MAPGGVETPELRQLVDAVRRVIAEAVTSEADAQVLVRAAKAIEAVADLLAPTSPDVPDRVRHIADPFDPHAFFPYSPVIGHVNPLALPVETELRDGRIHGRGRFTAAYEGPPNCVHGGVIAATFDELLGLANIVNNTPGMTGTLTVRYERPTPLHADLEFEAWTERVDGRKVLAVGEIRHAGEVTARCEGIFIQLKPDTAADIFPDMARGF